MSEDVTLRKLFIRNLSDTTTTDKLIEVFSPFGELADCEVVLDKITNSSKHYGFIVYRTAAAANRALEKAPKRIDGASTVLVMAADKANGKSPASNNSTAAGVSTTTALLPTSVSVSSVASAASTKSSQQLLPTQQLLHQQPQQSLPLSTSVSSLYSPSPPLLSPSPPLLEQDVLLVGTNDVGSSLFSHSFGLGGIGMPSRNYLDGTGGMDKDLMLGSGSNDPLLALPSSLGGSGRGGGSLVGLGAGLGSTGLALTPGLFGGSGGGNVVWGSTNVGGGRGLASSTSPQYQQRTF